MSRTGVEQKPPWRIVPAELKRLVGRELGSDVARGVRVWGSYGSGPSFRLRLTDGRRAFAKGLWAESNEFERSAFARELRIYSEMSDLLAPVAPEFLGTVECCGWQAMLLEDLGPKTAPPWKIADVRAAATGLAEFHRSAAAEQLPEWLPSFDDLDFKTVQLWKEVISSSDLDAVAGLSNTPQQARRWMERHRQALADSAAALSDPGNAKTVIHLDVRSDNLRVVDDRLRLFDWPFVSSGPPELDAAVFAQTVTAEGGPRPDEVLEMYAGISELRPEVVTSAVAMTSGFFAAHAPQPVIPGLPRLRGWQRAQLKVTLRWVAERLGLPDPAWVDGISVG